MLSFFTEVAGTAMILKLLHLRGHAPDSFKNDHSNGCQKKDYSENGNNQSVAKSRDAQYHVVNIEGENHLKKESTTKNESKYSR